MHFKRAERNMQSFSQRYFFLALVVGSVVVFFIFMLTCDHHHVCLEQGYTTWILNSGTDAKKLRKGINGSTTRNILLWNPYPEDRVLFGTRHILNVKDSCPINDCFVTLNHSYLASVNQFDAIVFLVPHIQFLNESMKRPAERRTEQRYVFYSDEPAWKNHLDLSMYKNYFNWTLSFQHYSDISLKYGRIERKSHPQTTFDYQLLRNKTKLVAWFVSTCWSYSNRETYVQELQQYIPVDIFGGCGPFQCPKDGPTGMSDLSCYKRIEGDYKFYLSFENSLCKEYVTEKFFTPLNFALVPVVLGSSNYSQLAPPHSYINALDYSPKQLADYLRLLDSNDTLYREYFQWKDQYTVYSSFEQMTKEAYCSLCDKLHNDPVPKTYEDMNPDWSIDTQCSPKWEPQRVSANQ